MTLDKIKAMRAEAERLDELANDAETRGEISRAWKLRPEADRAIEAADRAWLDVENNVCVLLGEAYDHLRWYQDGEPQPRTTTASLVFRLTGDLEIK